MQPAQGIRFIHIAIKHEAEAIEAAAAHTESPDELAALGTRIAQFGQINKLHTDGEEVSMYADLEQKLPHVRGAYLFDHHEDHALFADLAARVEAARTASAATRADLVAKLRRQTVALTEHVIPHVTKEDTLITPLIVEHFTPAEQGAQIGRMMGGFPPDVLARALPWLVGHLELADRCAYVGMMQRVMPAERFPVVCGWIKGGIGADAWSAISAAVPGLPA